jgi:hypothetical protein
MDLTGSHLWRVAQADRLRHQKRPSKIAHDRRRWAMRCAQQMSKGPERRATRDLLPLPLSGAYLSSLVGTGPLEIRWLARSVLALNALGSASGSRDPLQFSLKQFRQPLLFAQPAGSPAAGITSSQEAALEQLKVKLKGLETFEPTDALVVPAFVSIGRCEEGDQCRRPKESLVLLKAADPDLVDLPSCKGPFCEVSDLAVSGLECYDDPRFCLQADASFEDASEAPGYVGFLRGRLGRLYSKMHTGGLLGAFSLAVPVFGGVFAVAKSAGDKALRLISDFRRAALVLAKPRKVRILSPVGLAVFLRGAIRRRRLEGYNDALGIVTAKRDVSKYYHRLRMPRPWSFLFALPPIRLGLVRGWMRGLALLRGATSKVKPREFWNDPSIY